MARDPRNAPLLEMGAKEQAGYGRVAKVLAAMRNAEIERMGFIGH